MGGDQYSFSNNYGYFDEESIEEQYNPSYVPKTYTWGDKPYVAPPLNTTAWENVKIEMAMEWIKLESDGLWYGTSSLWTSMSNFLKQYRDEWLKPKADALMKGWDPSVSTAAANFLQAIGKGKVSLDEWTMYMDQNARAATAVADQIVKTRKEMQDLWAQYKKDRTDAVNQEKSDKNAGGWKQTGWALWDGSTKDEHVQDDLNNIKSIDSKYDKQAQDKMKVLADVYTGNWGALNEGTVYKGPTNAVSPSSVLQDMLKKMMADAQAAAAAKMAAAQKQMAAAQAAAQAKMAAAQKQMAAAQAKAQAQEQAALAALAAQQAAAQKKMAAAEKQAAKQLAAQQAAAQKQLAAEQAAAQKQMTAAQQAAAQQLAAAQQQMAAAGQQGLPAAQQAAMQSLNFSPMPSANLPGGGANASTVSNLGSVKGSFPGMNGASEGSPMGAGRPNLSGMRGGAGGAGMPGMGRGGQNMNPGLRGRNGMNGMGEEGEGSPGGRGPLSGRNGRNGKEGKAGEAQGPRQVRAESEEYLAGTPTAPNLMSNLLAGQGMPEGPLAGAPIRPNFAGRSGPLSGTGPRGPQMPGAPRGNRRLTPEELAGRRKRMAEMEENEELMAAPYLSRPNLNGRNDISEVDWENEIGAAEMGAEDEMMGARGEAAAAAKAPTGQGMGDRLSGRKKDKERAKEEREKEQATEAAAISSDELWTVETTPEQIETPTEKKVEQQGNNRGMLST